MNNQITLIIPDVHHKWAFAEKIIAAVGADQIVFLGDYFDDFNDTPHMVGETADWLNGSVRKPNRIHLWGNHDVHYGFPYKVFHCSGYEQWKSMKITDMVGQETWSKLRWFYVLDNTFLLSHAGIHSSLVPKEVKNLRKCRPNMMREISNYLEAESIKCLRLAANNQGSWMFNAGFARGGFNRVGGINWCDFNDEFNPTLGLNQIVGHTPQGVGPWWMCLNEKYKKTMKLAATFTPPDFHSPNFSYNLGLDVAGLLHYAVWNGETLKIGSIRDL